MKRTKPQKMSTQVEQKVKTPLKKKAEYDGNTELVVSTGSTLLDLAISGGRIRGGGIPTGIFVELFGPSSTGKTVLLCEIAGAIQRMDGDVMFQDPEGRLHKQFARIFDLNTDDIEYSRPDKVTEVFQAIREWKPKGKNINGVVVDSLAALSTDMEMDNEEGDKMGMKRAKDFSEQLRKTCRILAQQNMLMVASNQIRETAATMPGQKKTKSPGGRALEFYASLRLKASTSTKIQMENKVRGKTVRQPIGITTTFEVDKSSVWKPYRTAPVSILFDYGIDDIRENLQYLKSYSGTTTYELNGRKLSNSKEEAILIVEEEGLESELRNAVIDLWEDIEDKFKTERKPKKR